MTISYHFFCFKKRISGIKTFFNPQYSRLLISKSKDYKIEILKEVGLQTNSND